MADKLVILMSRGIDSEMSSVAFTLANGAQTAEMQVFVFLTSAAVDLARKRGQQLTHVPPLDPLRQLMDEFLSRGGKIWACPPCVTSRGYEAADFVDGIEIKGASAMFEQVKAGAATLSF